MIAPNTLLSAYSQGVFPMGMEDGSIGWFSPDPRGVLPLDAFHIPHGLTRTLRNNPFEIRINTAFDAVMKACAAREETWIDDAIHASYSRLHQLRSAHSVEAWHDEKLVGGLYGVSIGGAFFGESMFHTETNASKVALHALVQRLRERKFALLDIQWNTTHLATFGAIAIPKRNYLRQLQVALRLPCEFAD